MAIEHSDQRLIDSSNVDRTEVQKFNALADRWWNPDGALKTLHDINQTRVQWIDDLCALSGKEVLDVGCGGGLLSEAMARRGASVVGIDMAEEAIAVARQHASISNLSITYHATTVESLAAASIITEGSAPASASRYDVISCLEMIEHVPDPSSVIEACSMLLKPEGYLILSTLNRNIKSFLLAIVGAEYITNLIPRGTHEYQRFIKPSELSKLCRTHGLTVTAIEGLKYNPLTRSASVCKSVAVNYLLCARRFQAYD